MIVFPNSKINLGLRILHKRPDGYHDLETVFFPIPLTDALEINRDDEQPVTPKVPFSKSGFVIEGDPSDNLCIKAYRMLRKDFPHQVGAIRMHLHKAIPAGAGLGGGSADAAFTLRLLNDEFQLGLTEAQLLSYALSLGSDCPFFLVNKPCYATGRGEILDPIDLDLSAYRLLLVNPGIHVNTGRAFLHIRPSVPETSVRDVVRKPIERWIDELYNDFEKWVFSQHREIVDLKDRLYVAGAVFAAMSGSGSSVFGIFRKEYTVQLDFPDHYFVRDLSLS